MFKIAIVIFRESLEIALLLGVILAVTKNLEKSRASVIFGSIFGVFLASLFAFFAQGLALQFDGLGDEVFDSAVILLTAAIIGWTVVWMRGYEKQLIQNFGNLSEKIRVGSSSHFMLALMVATAILREGAEIILYIYSIASSETISVENCIYGLGIGASLGLIAGALMYNGLMKFAGRYIFKLSSILLIFIAASLASQAAGILTSAGIIELFSDQLWDSSSLVSDKSLLGETLNVIFGYDAKPNGMQVVFYLTTIIAIQLLSLLKKATPNKAVAR